jgi:hypothetical protein
MQGFGGETAGFAMYVAEADEMSAADIKVRGFDAEGGVGNRENSRLQADSVPGPSVIQHCPGCCATWME